MHTFFVSKKTYKTFVVLLFAFFLLFFSGCNFLGNSENSDSDTRSGTQDFVSLQENINWLPAYNSFYAEKLYIPLVQEKTKKTKKSKKSEKDWEMKKVFPKKKIIDSLGLPNIPQSKDAYKKPFNGEVFVNDIKIYGKKYDESSDYEILEKKYFSKLGYEEGAMQIGKDFHIYFAKNILEEGDMLKIVPTPSEKNKNPEIVEWKYERILFTPMDEIDPAISWEGESLKIEFPFKIEESKISRVKNFFQVSSFSSDSGSDIYVANIHSSAEAKRIFMKQLEGSQKKNISFSSDYNIETETVTIVIPSSEISEKQIFIGVRHFSRAQNQVNFFLPEKITEIKIQLGETFKKDQNFYSDLTIDFAGKLFEDKGGENSSEFIENRKKQKQNFLKNISIVPHVSPEILEENIFLTPEKAVITVLLNPETSYNIKFSEELLQKISPKFSEEERENKSEFTLETGKFSTKGIEMKEKKTLFSTQKLPEISVYSFPKPKKNDKNAKRDVVICKISAEEYENFENSMSYARIFEQFYREKFIPEYSHPEYFNNEEICQKKTVDFSNPQNITFLKNELEAGMYFASFVGEESILSQTKYQSPYERLKNNATAELSRKQQNEWREAEEEMNFIHENILLFSVVDTHITLKYDSKHNDFFWVTEEKTGKNAEGVEIFIQKSEWKQGEILDGKRQKGRYVFSEISLGKTDKDGVLKKNRGGSQYEFGSNILRYVAKKDGKFSGIISSSWNSGIAAWNFGMDNSGYGKAQKKFLAHIVPDRKLYEPGEKLFVKAIIRKDAETLKIPDQNSEYTIKLLNPNYDTLVTETVSPNEFGSVFFEHTFSENSMRGGYQVVLSGSEDGKSFELGRVSVEVQDFILPKFEINVGLEKKSIPVLGKDCPFEEFGDTCGNEEKISGDISLKYFSGGSMPVGKFSYKIYKKPHYEDDYWDTCYWGCYYNSSKSFVTSGQGEIKNGAGKFEFSRPLLDELDSSQYEYIAEVTVSDETGEKNTGSETIIVDSEEFSEGNKKVKFQIHPEKNLFHKGEEVKITLQANQKFLENEEELNDQQRFYIVRREYSAKYFKDISGNMRSQNNYEDFIESEISLNTENFTFDGNGKTEFIFTPEKTGEYRIYTKGYSVREYPEVKKFWVYPEKSSQEVMNIPVLDDLKINLIQEKFEYKIGETAKILVQSPFKKGTAFVTIEKDEVISHKEISLQNNVSLIEIPVDEKFIPNAYVSVIVKNESGSEYRLGYAEIIVNQSAKKLHIEISAEGDTSSSSTSSGTSSGGESYSPREKVTLKISGKIPDDDGFKPEKSEFVVAVIDESLISMIGNINMDVLKTFYDKIPFSIGTAMTNVAMKKNMYFSRRGIIGGSGSKGGGSASVFTRSVFKKTAFYKGDVVSDAQGNATVEFTLPDTVGQFRIVVIGNTKNNFFGAGEKTINVHQDVVIEEQFPLIFRRGDEMILEANVFNNTKKNLETEPVEVSEFSVEFSSKDIKIENSIQEISIPAGERKKVSWKVQIPENISFDVNEIEYEISATPVDKNSKISGDIIQKKITLAKTPLLSEYQKNYFSLDSEKTNQEILLDTGDIGDINPDLSTIEISVGNVPQLGLENILSSLAEYPHGCLEQTTSSTLPNALLLSFSEIIEISDFDENKKKQAQKNVEAGINRIFSMQLENGGFAYWKGETNVNHHYSPYAIWGLAKMKELGYLKKPKHQKKLKKAEQYLIGEFKNFSPENYIDLKKSVSNISKNGNMTREELVESLRALAVLKSDYFLTATQIITTEKEYFSDHEKIMYALALLEYDAEKYADASKWLLSQVDLENPENSKNRSYYGKSTDEVLLAQAWQYIDANSPESHKMIDKIKSYNLKSYFYSTATKNQSFLAFLQHLQAFKDINNSENSESQEIEITLTSPRLSDNESDAFTVTKKIVLTSEKNYQKIYLTYSDLFDPENINSDTNFDDALFVSAVKIKYSGKNPVFGMIISQTTPKNKLDIKASTSENFQKTGITVKREVFALKNKFGKISTSEHERQKISGKNVGLRMGEKYQVRITVSSRDEMQDIAVESYLPSGIKVLNSVFKNNETVSIDENSDDYWKIYWNHQEAKKDMVFASDSYFYNEKILEYTFVPTQEGEFYFPPVLAYAMYQPENRANTEYLKVSVGR